MIFSLPRRLPDASDVTQGRCSMQSSGFCPAVLLGETFRSVTVLSKARTTDTTAERIAIPKEGGDRRVRWVYPPSPHVLIQDYLLLGETGPCFIPPLSLSVVAIVLFIVGLLVRELQAASSSLRPVVRFSLVTSGMAPRSTLATTEGPKSAVGGSSMWKTSRNLRRTAVSCRESASTRSM
jgi:hypothetical protein